MQISKSYVPVGFTTTAEKLDDPQKLEVEFTGQKASQGIQLLRNEIRKISVILALTTDSKLCAKPTYLVSKSDNMGTKPTCNFKTLRYRNFEVIQLISESNQNTTVTITLHWLNDVALAFVDPFLLCYQLPH